jgi:hypothetical protein
MKHIGSYGCWSNYEGAKQVSILEEGEDETSPIKI